MTSELSKYLNVQLGVFSETTKTKLAKSIKKGFLSKSFFVECKSFSNIFVEVFQNFLRSPLN